MVRSELVTCRIVPVVYKSQDQSISVSQFKIIMLCTSSSSHSALLLSIERTVIAINKNVHAPSKLYTYQTSSSCKSTYHVEPTCMTLSFICQARSRLVRTMNCVLLPTNKERLTKHLFKVVYPFYGTEETYLDFCSA